MKKFIVCSGLLFATVFATSAEAGIFGRRRVAASRPVVYAPAYSTANTQTASAASNAEYRSFSYAPSPEEPATARPSAPEYGYPTQQRRNETGEPYHDAGFKVRGF